MNETAIFFAWTFSYLILYINHKKITFLMIQVLLETMMKAIAYLFFYSINM